MGTSELPAWAPPSITADANTVLDVALANVLPGDPVNLGFSLASTLPMCADT